MKFVKLWVLLSAGLLLGALPGCDAAGDDDDSAGDDDDSAGNSDHCLPGPGGFSVTLTSFDFSSAPAGLIEPGGLELDCTTGLLYGYAWNPTTSEESFVSIDPANGMVSSIGVIPQITGVVQGESTFGGSDYYTKGSDAQGNTFLVHVSLASGFSVTLTSFDFSSVPAGLIEPGGLELDSATGLLYGYAWNPTTSEESFVSIDPANGMVSNIGLIPQVTGVVQGASTFGGSDYYTQGSDAQGNTFLVHASLASGLSVTSTSFDFSSAPAGLTGPSGLEWDSATGLLYGYAWNPTSSEEAFVSIDPANGMVSNIGAIPQITGVTQGESTFGGSYFYFKGSDGSGGNTFLVGVQLP